MDRLTVFDHAGGYLFELAEADVFGRVRVEELNGEHSLTLTTTRVLEKGQRLLSKDATGKWREWVVQGIDADHSSGLAMVGTYYCIWSLQHDLSLCVTTAMPGVQTPVAAASALAGALEPTARWTVGTVTQTKAAGGSFYFLSSWEALGVLVERWGGEVDAAINVDARGNVTARQVCLYSKMGNQVATRRFDWGHDLAGVKRTVSDEPFPCRIIPRGKGEETDDGGYGRKIDITSVNGGRNYLQNDATAPLVRLPTPSGGWEYPTVTVENGEMETPADLKAWAEGVLESYTTPKVTYEADVVQLAEAGMDVKGVQLGDAVQCVDRGFDPDGVRVQGRVVRIEADELAGGSQLVLGNLSGNLGSRLGTLGSKLDQVAGAVQVMNGGTMSTADYLNRLLERVNAEINATGGYTYITEGEGIRTYDRAVSDPLVGAEASSVVEIKGGTIRIANTKTSSGAWNWRTVFTSGKIASDILTASNIITGTIRSAASGDYWNLDTGAFRLAGVPSAANTVKAVDVQYAASTSSTTAPESGWGTRATVWANGKFLWTREKMTMADGTESYSPGRLLANDKGLGASAVRAEYYLSTSRTKTQGGSWSAQKQAYVSGRWYWTRTRIDWSNGTVTYDPSVSGKLAEGETTNGATAADALAKHNPVDIFNELTDNGKVQGLYRTNNQLYVNAEYIKTGVLADAKGYNRWNLKTGDFSLKSVTDLDKKVGSISIGGTNLLEGTANWAGWTKRGNFAFSSDQANCSAPSAASWNHSVMSPRTTRLTYQHIRGKEVTISFDYKTSQTWGTITSVHSVYVSMNAHPDTVTNRVRWRAWQTPVKPSTTWRRYSFTVNVTDAMFTGGTDALLPSMPITLEIYDRSNRNLQVRRVKMELGNHPTDWSKAPQDSESEASAKANAALKDANAASDRLVKSLKSKTEAWIGDIKVDMTTLTKDQAKALDNATTQAAIAKKLFRNGAVKGIHMENGELYMNADYISSGTIDARVLRGGIIVPKSSSGGGFQINLDNGYIQMKDAKLENMNATGAVETTSWDYRMRLSGGKLYGYRKDSKTQKWKEVGSVDTSATTDLSWMNVGGSGGGGLKGLSTMHIRAVDGLRISAPAVFVRANSDQTKSAVAAFTGKIKVAKVQFGSSSAAKTYYDNGSFTLHFVHGMLVDITGIAHNANNKNMRIITVSKSSDWD